MARQSIEIGMTGADARDVLNENFIELYDQSLNRSSFNSVVERDTYFTDPVELATLTTNIPILVHTVEGNIIVFKWTGINSPLIYDPNNWELTAIQLFEAGSDTGRIYQQAADGTLQPSSLREVSDRIISSKVLAVESASINYGEAITTSEATYSLAITNNVQGTSSILAESVLNRNSPDGRISVNQAITPEFPFVSQPDDSVEWNTNPFIDQIPIQLTARTNRLAFRTGAPMSNVRIKITQLGSVPAIKYFPSFEAWDTEEGGFMFRQGENFIDFWDKLPDDPANGKFYEGFSTFQQTAGQTLVTELRADNVSILGDAAGRPWLTATVQLTENREAPFFNDISTYRAKTSQDIISGIPFSVFPIPVTSITVPSAGDYSLKVNGKFSVDETNRAFVGQIFIDGVPLDTPLRQEMKDVTDTPSITENVILEGMVGGEEISYGFGPSGTPRVATVYSGFELILTKETLAV